MKLNKILEHIECNHSTGELFVLKNNKRYRKIVPNEDNIAIVSINKTKIKMKYDRLVWCVVYKTNLSTNEVVFHKDLDDENCKVNNLSLIDKSLHFKILEAMKNINGALRLIPHPTDVFCYVLEYKQSGRLRKEVISDITVARKKLLRMQLRYIKFVSKYVLTN